MAKCGPPSTINNEGEVEMGDLQDALSSPERRITKEELQSLSKALKECQWAKGSDGVYTGESNGWTIVMGTENGKAVGWCSHAEWNVQAMIPSSVIERIMLKLRNLN